MTLPGSGLISLSDVNVELQRSGTTNVSLNDSLVRTLAGIPTSGSTIAMSNLLGKSYRPTAQNVSWTSYSSNGTTFSGTFNTQSGKMYVLVVSSDGFGAYFSSVTGMTAGFADAGPTSFFYTTGTGSQKSVVATKSGSGSYGTPMIYEITGSLSSTPVATSRVTNLSSTSISTPITAAQDGTLIISTLILSTAKSLNLTSTTGTVNGSTLQSGTAGTRSVYSYCTENVSAGSCTTAYSWTGSVSSAILTVYAIR